MYALQGCVVRRSNIRLGQFETAIELADVYDHSRSAFNLFAAVITELDQVLTSNVTVDNSIPRRCAAAAISLWSWVDVSARVQSRM